MQAERGRLKLFHCPCFIMNTQLKQSQSEKPMWILIKENFPIKHNYKNVCVPSVIVVKDNRNQPGHIAKVS